MSKKITTTIYITEDQRKALKELNRRSRVPVAEYIREGIDLALAKYSHLLPGQLQLDVKFGGLPKGTPQPEADV